MFQIGVIGCGRISSVYLNAFEKMTDLVSVCYAVDKDLERAKAFASHFAGCAYSDRIEDLLRAPLDCVHILTPHFLHAAQTIACLQAGFHVLTEKPIAILLSDGQRMIDTARACDRQLGVIFQNRYIAGIQEARRMLQRGELGRILGAYSTLNWWRPASYYECDWKGRWATEGGGVVIDQAIHSLDLVRYLMNCPACSIQAHIDRRILTSIEVEDVADAAITYENGAVHSFYACNYYANNADIHIEFQCEHGSFALGEGDAVVFHLENGTTKTVFPEGDACANIPGYWGRHHYAQIRDFYECLMQGRPVPTDPSDALKTLALVQGIYRSSRENCMIRPEA